MLRDVGGLDPDLFQHSPDGQLPSAKGFDDLDPGRVCQDLEDFGFEVTQCIQMDGPNSWFPIHSLSIFEYAQSRNYKLSQRRGFYHSYSIERRGGGKMDLRKWNTPTQPSAEIRTWRTRESTA
jgi:hypothetical protein